MKITDETTIKAGKSRNMKMKTALKEKAQIRFNVKTTLKTCTYFHSPYLLQ